MTQIATIFGIPVWVETEDPQTLEIIRIWVEKHRYRPAPPDPELMAAFRAHGFALSGADEMRAEQDALAASRRAP